MFYLHTHTHTLRRTCRVSRNPAFYLNVLGTQHSQIVVDGLSTSESTEVARRPIVIRVAAGLLEGYKLAGRVYLV